MKEIIGVNLVMMVVLAVVMMMRGNVVPAVIAGVWVIINLFLLLGEILFSQEEKSQET